MAGGGKVPEISIVIPTYNRAGMLSNLISDLVRQSIRRDRYEVIIIDDGSTDDTARMMAELQQPSNPRVIFLTQEHGFSGSARNAGIFHSRAPLILSLDDDLKANPDLVRYHLEFHRRYPAVNIGVVGRLDTRDDSVELLYQDSRKIKSIGKTRYGDKLLAATYFRTANTSLKKQLILQAGGFTPSLPRLDDLDLAFRLKKLDLQLVYCPEAQCTHLLPLDTLDKLVDMAGKYGATLAEWEPRLPHLAAEITSLGMRFNGGWKQLVGHPLGYFKDAVRRWTINRHTIILVRRLASKMLSINPTSGLSRRLCMEIWAYYYRSGYRNRKRGRIQE